jgi:hypothetical protein
MYVCMYLFSIAPFSLNSATCIATRHAGILTEVEWRGTRPSKQC